MLPPGQAIFTASQSWVVPAGVTEVCMVAIGAGGTGARIGSTSNYFSGGGGALAYVNAFAVTPGETLNIYVPNGGAASWIDRSGTNLVYAGGGGNAGYGGTVAVGTGFPGGNGYRVGNQPGGGGAGGYTSVGGDGANSYTLGGGVSPDGGGGGAPGGGAANAGPDYVAGPYGGGGYNTSYGGAVRIIWGAGRSFPNTNTTDL